jgi:hypothetical protein
VAALSGPKRGSQKKAAGLFTKIDPKSPHKGFSGVSISINTLHDHVKTRLTGLLDSEGQKEEAVYRDKGFHDDTWRHFVFQKRGNTLSIYANSIRIVSQEVTILNTYKNKSMVVIGANHENREGHNYLGRMDELRVYTRALSPREIKGLYDYESH